MLYGAITVSNIATLIVPANPGRYSVIIENNSLNAIWIGPDSKVTTASGISLRAFSNFTEDSSGHKVYCGPIYGIGTVNTDIRYWDRDEWV